jgi:SAM-dependent methyltransferase
MRVLDLGCGRAMSSIFLHREFGVQVWATDLWFSATENLERIRTAGIVDGVFPIHTDVRALPYANDFFDAIVSIDSLPYYGTEDLFLNYLAHFVKPGGIIAMAGIGYTREIDEVPEVLKPWWEPGLHSLHSAAWWRRHWEKPGIVDIELADNMPDAWQCWLAWQKFIAPENLPEIHALEADRGDYLTHIRCIARRRPGVVRFAARHVNRVRPEVALRNLIVLFFRDMGRAEVQPGNAPDVATKKGLRDRAMFATHC